MQLKGLLSQADALRMSLFGWFPRLPGSHPHMADRYDLLAFARAPYPAQFKAYLDRQAPLANFDRLPPSYFDRIDTPRGPALPQPLAK